MLFVILLIVFLGIWYFYSSTSKGIESLENNAKAIEHILEVFDANNIKVFKDKKNQYWDSARGDNLYTFEFYEPNRMLVRLKEMRNKKDKIVEDYKINKVYFRQELDRIKKDKLAMIFELGSLKDSLRFLRKETKPHRLEGWSKYALIFMVYIKERSSLVTTILETELKRLEDGNQKMNAWVIENGGQFIEHQKDNQILDLPTFDNGFDPDWKLFKKKCKEFELNNADEVTRKKIHIQNLREFITIAKNVSSNF